MKTVLNVKTDKEVKEKAQALAKHLGIPLSVIVNGYLKEFVHTGEFRVSREPELRPDVQQELEKAYVDVKEKRNVSPKFSNADDAVAWLDA